MCLGELGQVVERHEDVAAVHTDRGLITASVLLAPHADVGDHVVLHSGQVLSVVGAEEADHAAALRRGTRPGHTPPGAPTTPPHHHRPEVDEWTPPTDAGSCWRP